VTRAVLEALQRDRPKPPVCYGAVKLRGQPWREYEERSAKRVLKTTEEVR
jgi:hypothetical protein